MISAFGSSSLGSSDGSSDAAMESPIIRQSFSAISLELTTGKEGSGECEAEQLSSHFEHFTALSLASSSAIFSSLSLKFHKYQVTTGVSKIFLQLKISTASWFAICRAGDWALMKSKKSNDESNENWAMPIYGHNLYHACMPYSIDLNRTWHVRNPGPGPGGVTQKFNQVRNNKVQPQAS